MQIADGTVVAMDYELKDDEGTLLDQSQPGQPLTYLHAVSYTHLTLPTKVYV